MRARVRSSRRFPWLALLLGGVAVYLLYAPGCSRERGVQEEARPGAAVSVESSESLVEEQVEASPPASAGEPFADAGGATNPGDGEPVDSEKRPSSVDPPTGDSDSMTMADSILDRIPPAPMGMEGGASALANSPGYRPPDDPETEAVRKGRRSVPRIEGHLDGGASSPELLAAAILDALREGDRKALQQLRITRSEFGKFLWPEFPSSRAVTNVDADAGWFWVETNCIGGLGALLGEFGGRDLRLVEVAYETGLQRYTNFNLVLGVVIVALDENDREVRIRYADAFAERDGAWKVYTYKD